MLKKIVLMLSVLALFGACDRGDFSKAKDAISKLTNVLENFVGNFKEDQVAYFEANVVGGLDAMAVKPVQEAMDAEVARGLPILKQFKLDLEASFKEMKELNRDIQFYMDSPPDELQLTIKKFKQILGMSVPKKNGSPATLNDNFAKTMTFFARLPYKQEKLLEADNLTWGFKLSPQYEELVSALKDIVTIAVDLQKEPK